MKSLRFKFISVLLAIVLFSTGCATIQKAKKAEELEREVASLNQLIKEKDAKIAGLLRQLQEKEISYKKSLERLQRELNEYKRRPETPERKEPPLK